MLVCMSLHVSSRYIPFLSSHNVTVNMWTRVRMIPWQITCAGSFLVSRTSPQFMLSIPVMPEIILKKLLLVTYDISHAVQLSQAVY